jgi:hypothetical protein
VELAFVRFHLVEGGIDADVENAEPQCNDPAGFAVAARMIFFFGGMINGDGAAILGIVPLEGFEDACEVFALGGSLDESDSLYVEFEEPPPDVAGLKVVGNIGVKGRSLAVDKEARISFSGSSKRGVGMTWDG